MADETRSVRAKRKDGARSHGCLLCRPRRKVSPNEPYTVRAYLYLSVGHCIQYACAAGIKVDAKELAS